MSDGINPITRPSRTARAEARARAMNDRAVMYSNEGGYPVWRVPSATEAGVYQVVTIRGLDEPRGIMLACTCPDGEHRPTENGCHHRAAVGRSLERRDLVVWDSAIGNWRPTPLGRPLFQAAQRLGHPAPTAVVREPPAPTRRRKIFIPNPPTEDEHHG